MTDSKTVVEDLAVWLTAVWDEEERLATYALGRPWLKTKLYPDEPWHFLPLYQPELALARIAADRKILALHTGTHECPSFDDNCGWWEDIYCPTLLVLASAHADHPGFRPEWLVERQGVEQ